MMGLSLWQAVVFVGSADESLFVEPEGEPAGDGFFVAGFAVVAVPDVEGDGDGFSCFEFYIAVIFIKRPFQ